MADIILVDIYIARKSFHTEHSYITVHTELLFI